MHFNYAFRTVFWVSVLLYGSSAIADSHTSNLPEVLPNPLYEENAQQLAVAEIPSAQSLMDGSANNPVLEKAYRRYQQTGHAPVIKTQQFLQFPFGQWQPIMACQTFRACDIEFQPSEKIQGIYLGDTLRWLYEIAESGEGAQRQSHLIFKPKEDAISTNLIVTTNLRTYHLGLVSDQQSEVLQVKFYYPDDMNKHYLAAKLQQQQSKDLTIDHDVALNALDFNYAIQSPRFWHHAPKWKPVRAFNDGKHVYIQMPNALASMDAPSLFVVAADDRMSLVNYRVRGSYYIVDQLFEHAVLVSGVGQDQQRIELLHA